MEEKIENELNQLDFQKQICIDAINEYASNHTSGLVDFEKEKIENLLNRMFDAEMDFLQRNPEDYFEIYQEE